MTLEEQLKDVDWERYPLLGGDSAAVCHLIWGGFTYMYQALRWEGYK